MLYNNGLIVVIGIHAGWVFSIKTTKALTNSNPASHWNHLVGQNGIVGYLTAGWIALITFIVIASLIVNSAQNKQSNASQ
jgi:hypothetical protein